MRTIRPYNLGDEANIHPGDIMERVKLLENCINNQNKTIQNLVVKFENMEQNQAQVSSTAQTWPPLAAAPGHTGQRVDGRHQQAPGHRDVAHGAESGQVHQNQTQTRVEQLISNAYNKVQGQNRVTLTPKRRRVDDDSAGGSDRGEMNLLRSWADTASFGAAKQIDNQNTPRGTGGNHWRQRSLLVNGVSNDSNEDKSFAADISLVAGGVSKNANTDKLTDYLKKKGLDIVSCELLTTRVDQARTLSFKVNIKAEDFEKAKDPNIWPYRVVVRKFVNFRRREIDEFAPLHENQVRGVQSLANRQGQVVGRGQGGSHVYQAGYGGGHGHGHVGERGQAHQVGHAQVHQTVEDITATQNRFDVPGFREGGCH